MSNPILGDWLQAIAQDLIASFLAVVLGIGFTYFIRRRWNEKHFGGWHVVVRKNGATKVDRAISAEKAKEILREPSELSVFLKGVASPYGWINYDILHKDVEGKLLVRDDAKRLLTIDLDHNPQPPPPLVTDKQILDAIARLAQQATPLSKSEAQELERRGEPAPVVESSAAGPVSEPDAAALIDQARSS